MILYDFQKELSNQIYNSWLNHKNVIAVLPTGGGKTVVFSDILKNHKGVAFAISHRQELVQQMSKHLALSGISHKIIAPKKVMKSCVIEHMQLTNRSFYNPTSKIIVAGVDTLISRIGDYQSISDQTTLWIIDEAHHVLSENKWGKCVNMFPNAKGLGVTATASRTDRKGLGSDTDGVFDDIVIGPSLRELIDQGYLTDYEVVLPKSDFDLKALSVGPAGDYSQIKMKKETLRSTIIGDIVSNYCMFAFGKQAIVFATDVESSLKIADNFKNVGIKAESISAKTSMEKRIKSIIAFRNKEISILVNVDLFGEGFDVPAVECVIMARPTKSLGLFMQQTGRALRIMEGKNKAVIIDHVSNFLEHGLPDKIRYWNLDKPESHRKKSRDPDDIPLTTCVKCRKPYEAFRTCCTHCGFIPVTEARSSIEEVKGDLMLLTIDALNELRNQTVLESPSSIGSRVSRVAGEVAGKYQTNRHIEKIQVQNELKEIIALWAGYHKADGKTDSESYKLFYIMFGVDVLTSLTFDKARMIRTIERIKINVEKIIQNSK